MAQVEQEALIGRKIAGKFAVEAFIGSGAMGAVYRARQLALDKVVALKLLHRELARDATFPARFMREAKAASRIDHPNSMRVVDFGEEDDGTLYMAMEFLDGRDLFQVIQNEWPLSPPRIADLVMQTLAALAVAHDMGVVHRDLKPENIMILTAIDDEGHKKDLVKVCDFGIAKIIDDRSDTVSAHGVPGQPQREQGKLTTHGLVVGTPEYMSPEQGRGEALDARADLYSVGVILYQLLTGTVPFEANSALGVVLKHVTDIPLAPSQRVPTVDKKLEAICMKAMQKSREDRYQNAREMRADLRAFLEGGTPRFGVHQHVGGSHSSAPPMGAASHAGPGARTPLTTPQDLGVAATEVSIDSNAVRAASVRNYGSRLTPLGTDIDNELPAARGRWTGHLLAAALLIGVAGVGAFLFRGTFTQSAAARDHEGAPPEPSASAAPSAAVSASASPSSSPAGEEPKAAASAEPAPSHSAPHSVHTSAMPSPESLVEQAPPAGGTGSAAPSASGRAPAAGASASSSSAAASGSAPAASASAGKGKGKRPRTPSEPSQPSTTPSGAPTWGVVPPTTPPIVSPSNESHDPPAPSPAPTE